MSDEEVERLAEIAFNTYWDVENCKDINFPWNKAPDAWKQIWRDTVKAVMSAAQGDA